MFNAIVECILFDISADQSFCGSFLVIFFINVKIELTVLVQFFWVTNICLWDPAEFEKTILDLAIICITLVPLPLTTWLIAVKYDSFGLSLKTLRLLQLIFFLILAYSWKVSELNFLRATFSSFCSRSLKWTKCCEKPCFFCRRPELVDFGGYDLLKMTFATLVWLWTQNILKKFLCFFINIIFWSLVPFDFKIRL